MNWDNVDQFDEEAIENLVRDSGCTEEVKRRCLEGKG